MPRYQYFTRAVRAALLTGTIAVASGAWMSASHEARDVRAPETLVRLTNLGLETTSDSVQVVVYSSGPARVGIGQLEMKPLTDTLRLSSLPPLTMDVSKADVHVRLLTPGRMRLGGEVTNGRAIRFSATGRHILVLKGGVGVDTITDP